MNSFLTITVGFLLMCGSGGARNKELTSADTQAATKPSQAASPELAEAARLNAEMVKVFNEGKLSDALSLAKRVLEMRERALGPEHPLVITSYNNLAVIHREKGNTSEAEKIWLRILPVIERNLTVNGAVAADIVNQLAVIRFKKGDYQEAVALLQRGLMLEEKVVGQEHPALLPFLFNLFEFYSLRRDEMKATPFLARALDILEKQPARNDPATLKRLRSYYCSVPPIKDNELTKNLSKMMFRLGNPERAAELERLHAEGKGDGKTVVEGGVLNGKAISKPPPSYPSAALSQRLSGTVTVRIVVDEVGKVIDAEALCGHPVLAEASVEAARQAKFTSTLLAGKPVKVYGIITYNFVLR